MKPRLHTLILVFGVVLCVAVLFPFASAEDQPELGSSGFIYNARLGDKVSLSTFAQQLEQADYVLLGETHGVSAHHRLQQHILQLLIESGLRPAVVFEMFDREDDGLIATTRRRYPSDPDRIADATGWENTNWPDWHMYRPIVKTAMDAELQIVAGNFSRVRARQLIINQITPASENHATQLEQETRVQLGLFEPLPQGRELQLHARIKQAHANIPHAIVEAMVMAQRMRDAIMAEAMIARNTGGGAVLIAGREHARLDYGVPHYLRYREPESRIISITFASFENAEQFVDIHNSSETPAYNYVWVLPDGEDKLVAKR